MNKNALKRKSNHKVKTRTGKLPDNVGFGGSIGGYIRPLTKDEQGIQKQIREHKQFIK
jgi:hypothetical protein